MSIFKPRKAYRPFEYPEFYHEGYLPQHDSHWYPHKDKAGTNKDIADWRELSPGLKAIARKVLSGFAQTECEVENFWSNIKRWFPKPEISMMADVFSYFEALHSDAYYKNQVDFGLENIKEFFEDDELRARYDYLAGVSLDYDYKDIVENKEARKEVARALAIFSAFTEGVALYSSFAILYSFSRAPYGKLMGVSRQMEYSVRDECYSPDTEVLTTEGWVRFDKLTNQYKLAQYDPSTGDISFCNPSRLVIKDVKEDLISFNNIDVLVTPNHDMLSKTSVEREYSKVKAKELKLNQTTQIPISGYKTEGTIKEFSSLDSFRLAVLGQGFLPNNYKINNYRPINFSYTKQKDSKGDLRLPIIAEVIEELLNQLNYSYYYYEEHREGQVDVVYQIDVPAEVNIANNFSWIDLTSITSSWVDNFIEELEYWHSHMQDDSEYTIFTTLNKKEADKIQAICAIGGYATNLKYIDNNYCLYIIKQDYKNLEAITSSKIPYEGKVYCATVPHGALVTRRNNQVVIAGNCLHSHMGCRLFNKMCEEYPELREEVKEDIINASLLTIQLEHKNLDYVFKDEELSNLSKYDTQQFIINRINQKLQELGYSYRYDYDREAAANLNWFYVLTSGQNHTDFLNQRPTNYSKVEQSELTNDNFEDWI